MFGRFFGFLSGPKQAVVTGQCAYAKTYLEWCALAEANVTSKLARPLSPVEMAGIRNAGSMMMLEAVERRADFESDPAKIAESLSTAGESFEGRRREVCEQFVDFVAKSLRRKLSATERAAISECPYITSAMKLLVDLEDAVLAQRRAIFTAFLVSQESEAGGNASSG